MKDKNKIIIVSVIAILLVLVITTTFAYFLSRNEISNTLNIVTNIENENGSFITTSGNIELNITREMMSESLKGNSNIEANALLNVEYLSGTDREIVCRYDIAYEWVSEDNENPYTKLDDNEFTYEVKDGSNEIIKEETNFVASSNRNRQKIGTEYIANNSTSIPTKKQYTVNAKFYNIEADQSINANKNWVIKFYIDNMVCGLEGEVYNFDNDNSTYEYTKGISDNLTFEIETPLSNFNPGGNIEIDNETISNSNYSVTSGSTVITFNKSYIDNLSDGEHLIRVNFNTGGYAETTFEIKPGIYTVVYDSNEGTGSMEDTECLPDTSCTLRTNTFTKTNYEFLGWSTSSSATEATYTDGSNVTNLTTSGQNITLYAVWGPNYYNVSYNANNGSGAPSAQNNITWNSNVTIPNTTPTRSGYSFLGWSTNSSATSASYSKGNSYNLSSLTTKGGTVTLYAVWGSSNTYAYSSGDQSGWSRLSNSGSLSTLSYSSDSMLVGNPTTSMNGSILTGYYLSTRSFAFSNYNTLHVVLKSYTARSSSSYDDDYIKIGVSNSSSSVSFTGNSITYRGTSNTGTWNNIVLSADISNINITGWIGIQTYAENTYISSIYLS